MTGKRGLTQQHAERILGGQTVEEAAARLEPDGTHLPDVPVGSSKVNRQRALDLWERVGGDPALREILLEQTCDDLSLYQGNIENAIGLMRMPLGLAGPMRDNGLAAKGDYLVTKYNT